MRFLFSKEWYLTHINPMKGKRPWNKGKKGCFSEESRKKMSNGVKNAYATGKLKHARPMLGKHLSEETKRRISEALKKREKRPSIKIEFPCEYCSKPVFYFPCKLKKGFLHKFCGHSCATKYRNKHNNPMKNEASRKKSSESMKITWTRTRHPSIGKKRPDTTKRNKENNPMFDLEIRAKARRNYLKAMEEHPEKTLRAILRRNHITKLELTMLRLLHELGLKKDVDFVYNDYLKTQSSYRFPDFRFLNQKKIIETDGVYWHQTIENRRDDATRDKEFEKLGYEVRHYTEKELFEDYENTKEEIACLLGLK